MPFATSTLTLSTTSTEAARPSRRRTAVGFANDDTAITIRVQERAGAPGFPLYPQAVITIDRLSGGDPTAPYYAVAASGTPVIRIMEEFQ